MREKISYTCKRS